MKYAWIDICRDHYSFIRLCRVLGVSRSRYCQWRSRAPSARAKANAALDAEVGAIHRTNRGRYDRPRIVALLRGQGQRVGAEQAALHVASEWAAETPANSA